MRRHGTSAHLSLTGPALCSGHRLLLTLHQKRESEAHGSPKRGGWDFPGGTERPVLKKKEVLAEWYFPRDWGEGPGVLCVLYPVLSPRAPEAGRGGDPGGVSALSAAIGCGDLCRVLLTAVP